MFGRGIFEKCQSKDEKFSEPNSKFKNCPPMVVRDKLNTHLVILTDCLLVNIKRHIGDSRSRDRMVYNYLCNQCLSLLTL